MPTLQFEKPASGQRKFSHLYSLSSNLTPNSSTSAAGQRPTSGPSSKTSSRSTVQVFLPRFLREWGGRGDTLPAPIGRRSSNGAGLSGSGGMTTLTAPQFSRGSLSLPLDRGGWQDFAYFSSQMAPDIHSALQDFPSHSSQLVPPLGYLYASIRSPSGSSPPRQSRMGCLSPRAASRPEGLADNQSLNAVVPLTFSEADLALRQVREEQEESARFVGLVATVKVGPHASFMAPRPPLPDHIAQTLSAALAAKAAEYAAVAEKDGSMTRLQRQQEAEAHLRQTQASRG